jgi:hypothetical protein
MTTRKIWINETDWYSAESREEATRLMMESYGYSAADLESESGYNLEYEPLPDDKALSVTFQDGYENGRKYPPWADSDPEAKLEWVTLGRYKVARVTAPACIWAKHETGMVCSTEY